MSNAIGAISRIALSTIVIGMSGAARADSTLPFVEDDYPRALAAARVQKLPLAVEVHSAVCSVCRTMAVTVLRLPKVTGYAQKFVWARLEIAAPQNSEFLERFPATATPTFLVIEPNTEVVLAKHVGAADRTELGVLLEQSLNAFRQMQMNTWATARARADQAHGAGKYAEAARLYSELLRAAPPKWSGRSAATELWLTALMSMPDYPECTRVAAAELPQLRHNSAWVRSIAIAEYCTSKLPESPEHGTIATQVDALASKALEIPSTPLNRTVLYANMLATRTALKDDHGARRVADSMLRYIEAQKAKLSTAQERSALDPFLLGAATRLGRVSEVLPQLEISERESQEDPLPASVLSNAYATLRRYEDALAMVDRALAKSPTLTRMKLLTTKASLLQKKGDSEAAAHCWDEAIRMADGLPSSSRSKKILESLKAGREKALGTVATKPASADKRAGLPR